MEYWKVWINGKWWPCYPKSAARFMLLGLPVKLG